MRDPGVSVLKGERWADCRRAGVTFQARLWGCLSVTAGQALRFELVLIGLLYCVHAGEVVGNIGQGELDSDFFFPSGAKLADAALLLQHSEAGFDKGLALGIGLPSWGTS